MGLATRVLSKTSDQYRDRKCKLIVKYDAKIAKATAKGDTFTINNLKHEKDVMLIKYNNLINAWQNIEVELSTKKMVK